MSAKNVIDVIIDGRIYTIGGFESEAYLQKLATYISSKIEEFKQDDNYRRQKIDTQKTLLEINIADDYFKAKKQADMLQADLEKKENENYDLKHDLITADLKIETIEARLQEANDKNIELQKEIVKLQTELKSKK